MNFKKYIGLLLPTLLLLTGCSKENSTEPEMIPNNHVMTIHFPGRSVAQPTTYAGTYAADEEEKAITSARLFVFSDEGGVPSTLLTTEPITIKGTGNTEDGVAAEVFMKRYGTLHLIATANLDFTRDQLQKLEGKTFDEVAKTIVRQPASLANHFPMCSEPQKVEVPDPQLKQPIPATTFHLERLAVRIDIENLTTNKSQLVIKGVRIARGNINSSFLVKGQTPALATDVDSYDVGYLAGTQYIPNDGPDPLKIHKKLYTYEVGANPEVTVKIEIKGTYKGELANLWFPIEQELKRNTRYVLQLLDSPDAKTLDFELVEVKDWNEGGIADYNPSINKEQPIVTAFSAVNAEGTKATATHHELEYTTGSNANDVNSLKVTTPETYYVKMSVESPSTETRVLVNKAEYPWVSVKEIGTSNITGGKLKQDFLISFGKNVDLYDRVAELEIQNKYSPDKGHPHLIRISQQAAETTNNPLAYLANADVADLNQFAEPTTSSNLNNPEVVGKLYQFGRNVAFTIEEVESADFSGRSNGNDELLWNSKFMGLHGRWASFDISNEMTWNQIVAKATNAPASYIGTNGGDPSPLGYRLMTEHEMNALFPSISESKIYTFNFSLKNINRRGVKTIGAIHGVEIGEFTADYYTNQARVIYAIKFRGNASAKPTAFRYEVISNNAVKITTRVLADDQTGLDVQDIANPEWWSQNAGSDVVRFLRMGSIRSPIRQNSFQISFWSNQGRYTAINVFSLNSYKSLGRKRNEVKRIRPIRK